MKQMQEKNCSTCKHQYSLGVNFVKCIHPKRPQDNEEYAYPMHIKEGINCEAHEFKKLND